MRRTIPLAFLGLIVLAVPVVAQEQGPTPVALVKNWYQHFLGREADQAGLTFWVQKVKDGVDPNFLLSEILGADEYYKRAGESPKGLVKRLFRDVAARNPSVSESRYWLERANDLTNQELALEFLKKYGK